jgi:hypothetical protein
MASGPENGVQTPMLRKSAEVLLVSKYRLNKTMELLRASQALLTWASLRDNRSHVTEKKK